MNGTPPIVQTEHIDGHMTRVYISFTILARYVDYGKLPVDAPHPMVAIATVGKTSPIRLTERGLPWRIVYNSSRIMLGASCQTLPILN
jgi:hypothetical protein